MLYDEGMRIARERDLRTGDVVYSETHGTYTVVSEDPGDKYDLRTLHIHSSRSGSVFKYSVSRSSSQVRPFIHDGVLIRNE